MPGEDRAGAEPVVVLSHGFWEDRFHGDPAVLGRSLEINRKRFTIIGVMPADFVFPLPTTRLWIPYEIDPAGESRATQRLQVVGRLAPGVTAAQAQQEMNRIASTLAERHPETNEHRGVNVTDLRGALNFADRIFRSMALVLMAGHLLVLLIACANIAGVLLARSLGRGREMAIRTAMGASRRRVIAQLMTESAVLAVIGGAAGLGVAWAILRILRRVIPGDLYRVGDLGLDPAGVAFTFALALLASVLFGLVPAFRASGVGVARLLRESASALSASRRTRRLQSAFVIIQIALAVTLLISTLLILQSFNALRQTDSGLDGHDVLTLRVVLPRDVYDESRQVATFHRQVLARARQIPGARAVATTNFLPLNHEAYPVEILDSDLPGSAGSERSVRMFRVSPGYFDTLDIPMIRGRDFNAADDEEHPPVAVISAALADRFLAGREPIGRTLRLDGFDDPFTIVGVAANTRQWDLAEVHPQIFVSQLQFPGRYLRLLIEMGSDPLSRASDARAAIWKVDPHLPISEVRTIDSVVTESLLPQASLSISIGVLGLGALALAAVGLYGLMLFFVTQQRKELGVRMALGASRQGLLRLVLKRGLRLSLVGVVFGMGGALALGPLLRAVLVGVASPGPVVLVATSLALIAVSLLATWIPARSAMRMAPGEILREE